MSKVVPFKKKVAPVFLSDPPANSQDFSGKEEFFSSDKQVLKTHKKNKKNNTYRCPGYSSWSQMKQRCTNTRLAAYKDYGGRGITYSPNWETFSGFVEDMGVPPGPHMTLDRIDPNGNYEKSNCRWSSKIEQTRNRRSTHRVSYRGEDLPVAELAERLGIGARALGVRLKWFGGDADLALRGYTTVSRSGAVRNNAPIHPEDRWPASLVPADWWEAQYRQRQDPELTRPEYFFICTEAKMREYAEDMTEGPKVDRLDTLRKEAWQLMKLMGLDQSPRWIRWKSERN